MRSARCRGATYAIHVTNRGTGAPLLEVDGRAVSGTVVPWAAAGKTVTIECEV